MNAAIITTVGVVLVALITVGVPYIQARRRKKPTPVEEWAEERLLRTELGGLRREFETFRDKHNQERTILGNGFDALWRSFERLRVHWGDKEMPMPDAVDEAAIKAAQALRNEIATP